MVSYSKQDKLTVAPRKSDQDHNEITRGMITVAVFVCLGKLAAAFKEMVISWRYGVSADVDAYMFLFNLVIWPVSLWFGLLACVLVPLLAKAEHCELQRFKEEILGRSLIFGTAATAIVFVAMTVFLNSSLTSLPENTVIAAKAIVLQMSVLVFMGILVSLFSVALLAKGRHTNTLMESIPAIVIVVVILVSGGNTLEMLAWATMAGFTCHALCLALPLRRTIRVIRFSGESVYWTVFWSGFGTMLIGQVFTSMAGLVDQFYAARLNEGALSTLGYAQKILALLLGIGATAVGRALIPVIARSRDADSLQIHHITIRWVQVVFLIGTISLLFGWWLAPWCVKLLFERGAFTAQDSHGVTFVLRAGLIQMPFNLSSVILFYALVNRRLYIGIAVVAAFTLLIKLWANSLFVLNYGVSGLMLSTALTCLVTMVAYLYLLCTNLRKSSAAAQ